MLNPSDKELDRLSREAAEHYEPDEQILSWEQFVPRLDREIGVKPNSGFRMFGRGTAGFTVAVIALIGVSIFIIKQRKTTNPSSTPKAEISASTVGRTPEMEKTASQSSSNQNEKLSSEKGVTAVEQSSSREAATKEKDLSSDQASSISALNEKNTGTADKSASKLDKEKSGSGNISPTQTKINLSSSNRGATAKDRQNSSALAAAITASNANEHLINHQQTGKNITKSTGEKALQDFSGSGSATKEDMKMVDLGLATPALQTGAFSTAFTLKTSSHSNLELSSAALDQSKNTQRVLRMNRALKIGVLYGSDATTVHKVAPDKLSQSFGLTVGYQIHNHWSINTGIIYTQKNYSAEGKDFHLKITTTPPSQLDYVNGNCNMWEIPLTLRYDFDRINNTTIFINGGASSYLMTHESYMYYGHVLYYGGVSVPYQTPHPIDYDTKENYLFSVIDLSMGVEQKLSKSLSIQVEPYVKIPVKGVGLGTVDLSSYGVNLSLRFAPLLKTSRK